MSNLDPALDGSGQQRSEPGPRAVHAAFDRITSTSSDQYRPDNSNTTSNYGTPAQQTPYYHYQSSIQPSSAPHDSLSASSAQPTPDAHTFLPPTPHQTFLHAEDSQAAQDDAKRQRACEACRGLKVRCDQDPLQPDVPCKRCAKAGRPCVITQPSRKRQKKADSRVAELEKKLDALTAVLNNRHPAGPFDPPTQSTTHADISHTPVEIPSQQAQVPTWHVDPHTTQTTPSEPPSKRRRTEDTTSEWDTRFAQSQLAHKYPDAKSYLHPEYFTNRITSLVPPTLAAELFRTYTEQMTTQLPLVVFPKGTTGEQILRDKPVLYLTIMAAASFGQTSPTVTAQLQDESMAGVAELCVRHGVKSLELIQSMHVIALYFKPPNKAEQTNFYQIIHMAAVMALDIGLGRRYNSRKSLNTIGRQEIVFSAKALTGQNSDLIEARRAWLGCYYLCATASMVLRRPNLVRWTEYMKECIDVLENSPEAAASDRLLCQHVKLQRICEDIGQQFLMDDSTAQVSINDPKVTYALNVLENQLKDWKLQIPPDVHHSSLTFFEHVTSLYLHEIALHFNHNIEDFRLPFTEESLKNVDSTSDALSPNKIAGIEACLKAAHGILSTTLTFGVDELLALPMVIFFVRCIYALVILIKMHVAITMPSSELGKIIQPEDLKIEYFIRELVTLFRGMGESREAKPEKIIRIMNVLGEWFTNHKDTLLRQRAMPLGGDASQSAQIHGAQPNTNAQYDQTPLQMLSQVATGQQQSSSATDWTIDRADRAEPLNYRQKYTPGHPDEKLPAYQAQQTAGRANVYGPNIISVLDMLGGQDIGWSTGFEQAMDIMGDLPGGGLDNWYLGEGGMAPLNGSQSANASAQGSWGGV